MIFGRSSTVRSGLSAAGGSLVSTSNPAPAISPSSRAVTRSASFTSPPLAVLMISGCLFIRRNSSIPIRSRVSGFSGICSVMMSASSSTVSNGV
ncbi:hypothetical protein D3C80_1874220 [compost metagenome]